MDEPLYRPRRLRRNKHIRSLVAENRLHSDGLIQPYFVVEGSGRKDEILSMPGIYRESSDQLVNSIESDLKFGVDRIMLFGVTDKKDGKASAAIAEDNVVCGAVKELRDKFGDDLFISADVCLCAYTDHGHCGLIVDDQIDNDSSLQVLARMAVGLAYAGCDCVGPSDMMDGRVGAIRDSLDSAGYEDTIILAYSAKYASVYYGPFRDAADSAPQKGDSKSYQMDYRNAIEALREVRLDISEGADIVMVKPALAYLDIISAFKAECDVPIAAYNVSGEYSMVKLMAEKGYTDERDLVIENLTAINRAGADIILTYHFRDIMKNGWTDGR